MAEASIDKIKAQLQKAIELTKCKKCGCMKETLETILPSLYLVEHEDTLELREVVEAALTQIQPVEYN